MHLETNQDSAENLISTPFEQQIDVKKSTKKEDDLFPGFTEEQLTEMERVHYKPCLYKTLFLSLCFMLQFSAFNSVQNMIQTMYKNLGFSNLGRVSLLVLYFIFGVSSLFSSKMVSLASFKVVFILSAIGYNLFVGLGLLLQYCDTNNPQNFCKPGAVYSYVIIGSAITGVCASTIWVAQGGYMQSLSAIVGPRKSGFLVGVFWAIMQCSQILGNVLSYFILGISPLTYFYTMMIMGLVGNALFFLLPSVAKVTDPSNKDRIPQISDVWKLMRQKSVYPIYTLMAFTGVVISFYSGFLSSLVTASSPECPKNDTPCINKSNQRVALVFIALGLSEVTSGITSGMLSERFNLYKLATVGTLVAEVALVLALITNFKANYAMCFIIGIFFGYCDCFFNAIIQSICTQDYPGKIEIFAIFRLVLAFADAFSLGIQIGLEGDLTYIYIAIVFAFQIVANVGSRFLVKPEVYDGEKAEITSSSSDQRNAKNHSD